MKPLDLTKFRKDITKSLTGVSIGFKNPSTWISFDHFLTNWLVSGDFSKGFPLGKVGILAGEPGCLPGDQKVKIRLTPKK